MKLFFLAMLTRLLAYLAQRISAILTKIFRRYIYAHEAE